MNVLFHTGMKVTKVVIGLLAAMALIYRGNTYLDPRGPGLLVPVMCILSGMLVIGSTLAMTFKSQPASA